MTITHWYSNHTPVCSYYLYPTAYAANKTALLAIVDANIERYADIYYTNGGTELSVPGDWPIPDMELSKRPRPVEVARYTDYSVRPQGPTNFTWGFRSMYMFVYITYLLALGFYTSLAGADSGLWSIPITVQTRDQTGIYRCYLGTLERPVPDQDISNELGGHVRNIIFRFTGCVENTT